jgi:hypothetical protein
MAMEMLEAEAAAVAEIDAFKNPKEGWFEKLGELADQPLDLAGGAAFESAVGDKFENVVKKVVDRLNDVASWSVREKAIFKEFEGVGRDVDDVEDVADLPIEEILDAVGGLAKKYRVIGAAEGAVTGVAGALGMAVDIPALVALSLRAINEHATYFGFDIESPEERCYAVLVLAVAATATDNTRLVALQEISEISKAMADPAPPTDQERTMTAALLERTAHAVVVRLAKGKLAQVVPIVGSAIGGGYNSAFLGEVCRTAKALYAERWLMRRHGTGVAVEARAVS